MGIVISASLSFSLTFMAGFHIYLLAKNYSTIEMGALKRRNPFDLGKMENLGTIFGPDVKTWFFPIEVSPTSNGIDHPLAIQEV